LSARILASYVVPGADAPWQRRGGEKPMHVASKVVATAAPIPKMQLMRFGECRELFDDVIGGSVSG